MSGVGTSPVHEVSCFVINAVVDVSMLRTAKEAKLRLPLRYLAFSPRVSLPYRDPGFSHIEPE